MFCFIQSKLQKKYIIIFYATYMQLKHVIVKTSISIHHLHIHVLSIIKAHT